MGDGFKDARQAWLCLVGKADGMAETHLCGTGVYSPHKKGRLEYKWQPECGPEHVGKERPLACMRDVVVYLRLASLRGRRAREEPGHCLRWKHILRGVREKDKVQGRREKKSER